MTNDHESEVQTMSGRHPFRRQHARQYGARAAELVAADRCPRCEGALYPPEDIRAIETTITRPGDPYPMWRPAGSRATECRCIPICEMCAYTEALAIVATDLELHPEKLAPSGLSPDEINEVLDALRYVAGLRLTPERWPVDRPVLERAAAALQWYMGTTPVTHIHLYDMVMDHDRPKPERPNE